MIIENVRDRMDNPSLDPETIIIDGDIAERFDSVKRTGKIYC